jgi:hypothetical protein
MAGRITWAGSPLQPAAEILASIMDQRCVDLRLVTGLCERRTLQRVGLFVKQRLH